MSKPVKPDPAVAPPAVPSPPPGPVEAPATSSYKCEECGNIIAAPSANPTPRCCGEPMRKIR